MKLELWSAAPRLGDVPGNVKRVADAVRRSKADLVVFPEMFLSGYGIGDDAQRLALSDGDARLKPLVQACKATGRHAVTGTPRTSRPGVCHNSALLVRPDGGTSWYDKRCLATFTTFREGLFFRPGAESPVWRTDLGAIGIGICYDLYFPELHKRQALAGADLLLNISASPATSRPFFETLLQARAIENACFAGYSNNVGAQDGIVFWGGAQAIGPRGQVMDALEPYAEGRVVADLDWGDLRPAREFRPTLRDSQAADLDGLEGEGEPKPVRRKPAKRRP